MESNDRQQQQHMLYLSKFRRLKNKHILEISKTAFYRNFFDVVDYQKEHIKGGAVCLVLDRGEIIAYRDDETFFEVDLYTKTL